MTAGNLEMVVLELEARGRGRRLITCRPVESCSEDGDGAMILPRRPANKPPFVIDSTGCSRVCPSGEDGPRLSLSSYNHGPIPSALSMTRSSLRRLCCRPLVKPPIRSRCHATGWRSMSSLVVTSIPRERSLEKPAHHVGSPPTAFTNPWPSFDSHNSIPQMLSMRFGRERNFVPVPKTREELVQVRMPNWGADRPKTLRATWFGHASFLLETSAAPGASRGVRILADPVFAERVGPWGMVGPKRFSPTPCKLEEVPEVDAVIISHNHYDHLDVDTIKYLYSSRKRPLHFFCGLNVRSWFIASGIAPEDVTELDWWDGVEIKVEDTGSVRLTCTPAQHFSGRTGMSL